MATKRVPDDELELDVKAYYDAAGDKAEAARSRGLNRRTYADRLCMAESRLGVRIGKVADGKLKHVAFTKRKLPKKGHVARYFVSSLQNNTHPHPGFNNVLAYVDYLDGYNGGDTCELIVGTFSYQKATYGKKAVKRDSYKGDEADKDWYALEVEPYIVDDSVELAPGLIWCGEQNILPTNKNPLASMEDYNGRSSNIVPHAAIEMRSVPSMPDEATKFNYSTGTVGQMNYIQKRAGILAERRHTYGGLLVEVDDAGNWWVRQIYIDQDDAIMDVGPRGTQGVYVQLGEVHERCVVAAMYWADYHAVGMSPWVKELCWGEGGMLDELGCRWQFVADVLSMRSRSPHEEANPYRWLEKHYEGEDSVQDEVDLTASALAESTRPWCETVVVQSNHDDHLDQWLERGDIRRDPLNKWYYHFLSERRCRAVRDGEPGFNTMEFALRHSAGDALENVRFLGPNDSFVILKDVDGAGVECALHGHRGPDGARGTSRNLTKLGRRVSKGHDHKAGIYGPVFSTGSCAEDEPYANGPGSWSVSHSPAYENGQRCIITMWAGKWRA